MTSIGSEEVDYDESDSIESVSNSFDNDDHDRKSNGDDNRKSDEDSNVEDDVRQNDEIVNANVEDVATGVAMDIVNDDKEDANRLEVENKRIANKRTHSDNSENERESKRVSRRTNAHEVSEDTILQDTFYVFAMIHRRLDEEVHVYKSDLDTFKRHQNSIKMDGIRGYLGNDDQIVRLLHLYKYTSDSLVMAYEQKHKNCVR